MFLAAMLRPIEEIRKKEEKKSAIGFDFSSIGVY
jgi:hypothetical protein